VATFTCTTTDAAVSNINNNNNNRRRRARRGRSSGTETTTTSSEKGTCSAEDGTCGSLNSLPGDQEEEEEEDDDDDDCVDTDPELCKVYASDGVCDTNPKWMYCNCPQSCKICSDKTLREQLHCDDDEEDEDEEEDFCEDMNENCLTWAENDECTKNPKYMSKNCCKSCGEQEQQLQERVMYACVDLNNKCKRWADDKSKDPCTNNSDFMMKNCPVSCHLCPQHMGTYYHNVN
jgi:hypothetical protein